MQPEELLESVKIPSIRVCWTQWVGLGSPASPTDSGHGRSIIDLEALLAFSLYLSTEERRLRDMAGWWARVASQLTSVQRFRALCNQFPGDEGRRGFEAFAAMAAATGDKRWARHAGGTALEGGGFQKGRGKPNLIEPCTLWLRLRAGLGVGAKADVLAYLLGSGGAWASVNTIAFSTGYSSVTIRKAVSEMAMARLIRETQRRPSEYQAPPEPWWDLLGRSSERKGGKTGFEPPRWRYWLETFAFLVGVMEWSRLATASPETNPFLLASKARDLMEKAQRAFALNSLPTPPPEAFPGRQAPHGLAETTEIVLGWMEDVV